MAVLQKPLAPGPWRGRIEANGDEIRGSTISAFRRLNSDLRAIVQGPLPADMVAEECSMTVLFRASRALNLLTGGAADMTFSARCHVQRLRARRLLMRVVWGIAEDCIDAICGIWRGECEHCATAWDNHRARARSA